MSPAFWQDLAACSATAMTLVGVWICWQSPRYRMSVEEHTKDGHLTEADGRRKLRLMAAAGPTIIVVGIAVLAGALFR